MVNSVSEIDILAAGNSAARVTKDWHELTSDEVLTTVHSRRSGLSFADVAERRSADGPNSLQSVQRTPWSRILLRQFKSMLIWVLVAAAILSALLGEWIDCVVVLTIV